jgi:DoxX-like family
MFEKIGLGQWFRYVTGSLEVIGAVLLLAPRTAAIGGWLLAAVMIGAIGTHLFIIGGSPVPAAVARAGNYGRLESIEAVRNAAMPDVQCRAFSFGIGEWSG